MTFPQRFSYITLGVRDMPTLRSFYAELGWHERPGSSDDFATYEAGGVLLALYPLGQFGQEAAPGEPMPDMAWNGITLGVNVESAEAVDETFRSALVAGARSVAGPVEREWGGYSGYFADPEGNDGRSPGTRDLAGSNARNRQIPLDTGAPLVPHWAKPCYGLAISQRPAVRTGPVWRRRALEPCRPEGCIPP